jgi:hypothetical protein
MDKIKKDIENNKIYFKDTSEEILILKNEIKNNENCK